MCKTTIGFYIFIIFHNDYDFIVTTTMGIYSKYTTMLLKKCIFSNNAFQDNNYCVRQQWDLIYRFIIFNNDCDFMFITTMSTYIYIQNKTFLIYNNEFKKIIISFSNNDFLFTYQLQQFHYTRDILCFWFITMRIYLIVTTNAIQLSMRRTNSSEQTKCPISNFKYFIFQIK